MFALSRRIAASLAVLCLTMACDHEGRADDPPRSASPKPSASQAHPSPPRRLIVATNVWALKWLVDQVGGRLVVAERFEAPAHETPTADDLALITRADAVVYLGNLSDSAARVLAEKARVYPDRFKDIASVPQINLIEAPQELGDDRLPGGRDPHVWLDPGGRMVEAVNSVQNALVRAIEDDWTLAQHKVEYAKEIADRAEQTARALTDMTTRLKESLRGCRGKVIVAEHPAYGYLATVFGLRQLPLTRESWGNLTEPAAARQRQRLSQVWQGEKHRTIFLEQAKEFPAALKDDGERTYIHKLANEYNARLLYLSSLEIEPEPTADNRPQGYLEAIQTNAENIRRGLGC